MEVIYGFFKRFPAGVSKNTLELGLKDTYTGCCHSWVGKQRWEAARNREEADGQERVMLWMWGMQDGVGYGTHLWREQLKEE